MEGHRKNTVSGADNCIYQKNTSISNCHTRAKFGMYMHYSLLFHNTLAMQFSKMAAIFFFLQNGRYFQSVIPCNFTEYDVIEQFIQFVYQNICNKLLRMQIYMCVHNLHRLYRLFMHFTAIYVILNVWVTGV